MFLILYLLRKESRQTFLKNYEPFTRVENNEDFVLNVVLYIKLCGCVIY